MLYLPLRFFFIGTIVLLSAVLGETISRFRSHHKRSHEIDSGTFQDKDVLHWPWDNKDKFKCPSPFGAFSDVEDCSMYYVCVGSISSHKKCPRLKQFDKHRRMCMPFMIAVCDTGITTGKPPTTKSEVITTTENGAFKCPSIFGSFMHPTDCSKYYFCAVYMASLKTCPDSQLFDETKRACRPEDEVDCGKRIRPTEPTSETTLLTKVTEPETTTEPVTEPETTTEHVTEPETTTEPVTEPETTTEQVTEPETTTEQVTEPETTTEPVTEPETTTEPVTEPETTTEPDEETTTEKVTAPETTCSEDDIDCIIDDLGEKPAWFKCPKDVGGYPHPSSKKLFIFCLNWKPTVKKCGQDLIFSEELLTCVSP